ncbi:hypothetical protein I5M27_07560 [Adhaeribacter sp. BT258]|uniref:Uncharacterized protein n=1 Tax=Adhaeribacter terrigena TaxID=2793070 RepID=A0ABS1C0H3_9BACT|nr:hypothetical protein [Adhaeribacter terrigena]MBK0402839.1 hypothetical protein [Adhaeribacter terrigena]
MNSKNLSLSFIFYGLLLFGAAAFSFWAQSWQSAAWFFLGGIGIFIWAHFLNRKHYWGFTALLGQLFVTATALGWNVISYFRSKAAGATSVQISETGFIIYSALFVVTVAYLLFSTSNAARIRQELT